ncbi:hypothetical protein NKI41_06705 [Mesorhizobium sp. M0601]|uniref:hypothetical protein n=1 Tax=Mesorhizobium sp. M0601 TaxID=2956969 RepID=UPI003336CEF5
MSMTEVITKKGSKPVVGSDLEAKVYQSACDKLLGSVAYPFTVVERRQDFPGCSSMAIAEVGEFYEYSKAELGEMFESSIRGDKKDSELNDKIYSFAGSIIEQAKKVLDAADRAGREYVGPDKKELQAVVDGGIENLIHTLGDWGAYAWCPYLRVRLDNKPNLRLASPRIDLTGVVVNVKATGELWVKYPWWNCYKFCFNWKKVIKCDRVASVTVSVGLKAQAHADLAASGTRILAHGVFDKLRLNYKILDKIPLEGIANEVLAKKLLAVYDASQLVETVPLLHSRFAIASIALPASADGIGIGATIKQI